MRQGLLLLCFCAFGAFSLSAQIGCPGCQTNLPPGLPADTLFLQNLPDGEKGLPYDEDIAFRVPKTTTPVHAVDSTTPAGLPISKIEILSVEGLPPGLNWEPSQWEFQTDQETDGCIRICGTPTTSDSFLLLVKIKATVFVITQEASFPMKLYIAPPTVTNDGFSMTNYTGCGSTTVSFVNNHPSDGSPNFQYIWAFGDVTSFNGENPPAHSYDEPGVYVVDYYALIDTGQKVLVGATVQNVECVDQLGLGTPDLYLRIEGPDGVELFESPVVNNTPLPFTFPINLSLGAGNYLLEVWDEDGGLKGTDDACGAISFNVLSDGTLVSGGFTVTLNIEQPVTEIYSADTVYVFEQPDAPAIAAPNGLTTCAANPNIVLLSSAPSGNQWLLAGEAIAGAVDSAFTPAESGYYQVQFTDGNGCSALSDSVFVGLFAQPPAPAFGNHINRLYLLDSLNIPAGYTFQWFESGVPIPGETGVSYCIMQNGLYGLVVTDAATGCSNFYAETVTYDPNYPDCVSGTEEAEAALLGIFPNPATQQATIQWRIPSGSDASLRVCDAVGRWVQVQSVPAGATRFTWPCDGLPAGVYTVTLLENRLQRTGKLVIAR